MTSLFNALSQAIALLLAPPIARTSTLTGTALDVLDYEGEALCVLNAAAATAGTTPTLNVKLQDCATSNGTFADVTDAAFVQVTDVGGTAGVQYLKVNVSALKRYLRVIGTIAGANASFDFSAEFIGVKKAS